MNEIKNRKQGWEKGVGRRNWLRRAKYAKIIMLVFIIRDI